MIENGVLMSINYKWCKKIIDGQKKMEVRKSAPKLSTPYKVYMYCTKDGQSDDPIIGKVFGEFICRDTVSLKFGHSYTESNVCISIALGARISPDEMYAYGKGKDVTGMIISNLKLYDEPKELSDFMLLKDSTKVKTAPMNFVYVKHYVGENNV